MGKERILGTEEEHIRRTLKGVLQQVRDRVWDMRRSEDIEEVLLAVKEGLKSLGVPFEHCGVNLVDERRLPLSVCFYTTPLEGKGLLRKPDTGKAAQIVLRIWRRGEVAYRRDLEAEDLYGEGRLVDEYFQRPIRAIVDVPFAQGTLALNSTRAGAFSEADLAALKQLGAVLEEGFRRQQDLLQLEERHRELSMLVRINQTVSRSLDLEEVLDQVAGQLQSHFCCDAVEIGILDRERSEMELRTYGERGMEAQKIALGQGLNGWIAAQGRPLRTGRPEENPAGLSPADGIEAFLGVPVFFEAQLLGVISLNRLADDPPEEGRQGSPFSPEEEGRLQAIAASVGTAIRNAGLHAELRRREGQQSALHHLREAVWKMQSADDIEPLVEALRHSLLVLQIPFQNAALHALNPLMREFTRIDFCLRGPKGAWVKTPIAREALPLILRMWRSPEPTYRRDLDEEDPRGERERIRARWASPVRSVLDLPFSHGLLALNSTRAGAFSEAHIRLLQKVTQVLSEGFRRLDDLQRLVEQKERYRSLVESLPVGILESTPEGKVLYANPQAREIFGCTEEELLGKPLQERYLHPEDREKLVAALQEKGEHRYEYPMRRQDGRPLWIRGSSQAVRDPGGKVLYFRALIEDISWRKETEEHQEKLEAQLRHAQKMQALGQLTAGIAHNFNNLLMGILNHLELSMLEAGGPVPALQEARAIALRAAEVVEQLVIFARAGAPLEPAAVELGVLLRQTLTLLRPNLDRRIAIEQQVPAELPLLRGDANRLEQVFLNLLLNARDALEEEEPDSPGIRIEAGARRFAAGDPALAPQSRPGAYLRVEIADNGCGMDEETRRRIFEPFFTTKEIHKGTGLGLSTSYAIVREHGGWIECRSRPGGGSAFSLYLPAIEEKASMNAESPPEAHRCRGSETLLVVEDEEGVRRPLVSLLERYGYTVWAAADGLEAVDLFQRQHIALVLLDLSLPKLSGAEVLARLRRLDPEVRVILSTGYAAPETASWEVQGLLKKPYKLDEALRLIRQVLDR